MQNEAKLGQFSLHQVNPPGVSRRVIIRPSRETALSDRGRRAGTFWRHPMVRWWHTDPWDHVESAMASPRPDWLEPARAAFDWSRCTQRSDGSWPIQFRNGIIGRRQQRTATSAPTSPPCLAHVFRHPRQIIRARRCGQWVVKAVDFVIDLQVGYGEICWARSETGPVLEALLTGCASVFHSIRCALRSPPLSGEPQPEWELALGRLGHALVAHPEAFTGEGPLLDGLVLPHSLVVRCGVRRRPRESSSGGRNLWSPILASVVWTTGPG